MRVKVSIALTLATVLGLIGCASNAPTTGKLARIRIAVLPGDDSKVTDQVYEPYRSQLEKGLGMPVELIRASDYSGVIEAMKTKKCEIGLFGPLSYVLARKEAGAEGFAANVRPDGSSNYHSLIIVKSDSPYHSLKDLKGKKFALVDPASASGCLMPRYMTQKETGTPLESYFSQTVYTGTHPASVKAVATGAVDGAGVEEFLIQRMEAAGQIPKDSVREIMRSEELPPGGVWAYRKDMENCLCNATEQGR